ncbi:hypothetical protein [Azospirillum argentinense]
MPAIWQAKNFFAHFEEQTIWRDSAPADAAYGREAHERRGGMAFAFPRADM